ncbi:MAG TPA: RNA 2'-phosphotransferase [Chthonomonadaceae bacterium]|nr:RNA 2'-phosphotransferase [Chthonomonadaceae bacterium]
MESPRVVHISKFLSKHLRHEPERIGLRLEAGGWVSVEGLLAACRSHGFLITRADLEEVVARNDKQRFSFDAASARIRANQGHSIAVDLQLEPASPPQALYHGTAERFVPAILAQGLKKMSRHHVHLSTDEETAIKVGQRHGRPVVFEVDAAAMEKAGFVFYVSSNGVWLVDSVPPHYLKCR